MKLLSVLKTVRHKKILLFILSITTIFICHKNFSQTINPNTFFINSRLSFYSYENSGEFLVHLPPELAQTNLLINIKTGADTLVSWNGRSGKNILRLTFPLNLKPAVYDAEARITVVNNPGFVYQSNTKLIILPHKPNEVKTDNLTGGLIVNKMKFFPFGFYCYSPVYPTLPEEEVVKGFNLMSPYQKIIPETLNERKAYMDRCAQLGMKVNYNLLSVSGGGGVGSKIEDLSDEEKMKRLISEIAEFRDHPALLCWYVSDEPNGFKIPPEKLEEIYRIVKENDPWHPVSIVFTAPFIASKKYTDALDIVMADPYPIPDLPVSKVGDVAGQLKKEFYGKKPVWIVPQAFGGGEIWSREPTQQEIRSMTWQAIISGATGIQYFVRQGLNYFPKSAATWSECGRIAMEVAELTPWLLSDEETLHVESNSDNIIVSSGMNNNQLLVMAVNKTNEPVKAIIRINGLNRAIARLIFENRSLAVTGGLLMDQLAPFGSQVYLIDLIPGKPVNVSSNINLIKDPGFEDIYSPGIPSGCYARPGDDRGATYFLDTKEYFEGNHSLRIRTPENDKSLAIRFFPIPVKAGVSYTISIWAKSDPEQRLIHVTNQENDRLLEKKTMPQYVEILLGDFGRARFVPDNEWRRFVTFVTIPTDTTASFKTNLILKMPGQGVAWFDEVKVFEEK